MPNETMIAECPNGSVFFDIGANVGSYTLMMAKKAKMVYAFEPGPENIIKLRQNVSQMPNVEVHGFALSNFTGLAKLMLHPANPGGHSLHEELDGMHFGHKLENSVDVAVMTLDDWCACNDITEVHGIKIDVEAHEQQVLEGAKETLKKYHPLIALETHQVADMTAVHNVLEECGYDVGELEQDRAYLLREK